MSRIISAAGVEAYFDNFLLPKLASNYSARLPARAEKFDSNRIIMLSGILKFIFVVVDEIQYS